MCVYPSSMQAHDIILFCVELPSKLDLQKQESTEKSVLTAVKNNTTKDNENARHTDLAICTIRPRTQHIPEYLKVLLASVFDNYDKVSNPKKSRVFPYHK